MIRVFGLLLSGVTLIILCPLLMPIMLILKFFGEGEMFFYKKG